MPMIKGFSRKAMSENISREVEAGIPHKQAVARSYSTARKAAQEAGKSPDYLKLPKKKDKSLEKYARAAAGMG